MRTDVTAETRELSEEEIEEQRRQIDGEGGAA
ncbi:unknown [Haloarcula marismortui ATCC 43049]|uniref:Uncharacterized protein n=1 Tax=Haloarcula marismortui (strain ATCC 43049 / DSM 3752 / JCM 8966 / VKM B-1809) TaxID=272569 RepID=Q5V4E2_HALMA|nr:unknown [Haloarcula marismortui ATCC 43049]